MDERIEKMNEAGLKRIEDKKEQFNNEIRETFEGKFDNDDTLNPEVDKNKEETNKEMERCLKNMSKTLDSTAEGIIDVYKRQTQTSRRLTTVIERFNGCLLYTSRCV